jgi:hypothetical protein
MGQSSRRRAAAAATVTTDPSGQVPVVGQREPCPCGSGRKYKACHGRASTVATVQRVARPFAGLPGEVDWVALREVVPAATATVRLAADHRRAASDDSPAVDEVIVATVLPLAWPALRRADGTVLIGLQSSGGSSGDPSRDLASALLRAVAAEPGSSVEPRVTPADAPRLQDRFEHDAPFEESVHPGFEFWVDDADDLAPDVRESLERANAASTPTARLTGVDGAYWARVGEREHLRWVLPHDEDALLDAIARLHAAGASGLGEGTRYIGSFRAHGLLVPVWDLPAGAEADDVEEPAVAFARRLDEALAQTTPLTYEQRRARAGVVSRQLTLR